MSENDWTLGDQPTVTPDGWITSHGEPQLPDSQAIFYRMESGEDEFPATVEELAWCSDLDYRLVKDDEFGPWVTHQEGDDASYDGETLIHVVLSNGRSKFDEAHNFYWDDNDGEDYVVKYRVYEQKKQMEAPPFIIPEGWTAWHGQQKHSPVNGGCHVEILRRDERKTDLRASQCTWDHHDAHYDIMAYKVIKWVIDPEEEFVHERHDACPVPLRTTVFIKQSGRWLGSEAPASTWGWSPVEAYRIVKE